MILFLDIFIFNIRKPENMKGKDIKEIEIITRQ